MLAQRSRRHCETVTGGITIGHFVMAITGRRYVCGAVVTVATLHHVPMPTCAGWQRAPPMAPDAGVDRLGTRGAVQFWEERAVILCVCA